jgi:hypothetical protein
VAGGLTLVSRALVNGPILRRYGIRAGLLALPLTNAVGVVAMILTGTLSGTHAMVFWLTTLTKLLDRVLGQSVYQAAFMILYQPLPVTRRLHTQTVTDSFVEPAATGLAGVGLWVLGDLCGYGPLLLSATLLVIMMAWIIAMVLHSRQYPVMLSESD